MASEVCGKRIGRHVITKQEVTCGLPKNHTDLWCVSAEAIEAAQVHKSNRKHEADLGIKGANEMLAEQGPFQDGDEGDGECHNQELR